MPPASVLIAALFPLALMRKRDDASIAGALLTLALFSGSKRQGSARSSPAAPARTSSKPTPATDAGPSIAPLPDEKPDDSDLVDVDTSDNFDVLWARYALHPDRPGPKLQEHDQKPTAETRTLTDFEIWALAPYFPVVSDLGLVTVHNGIDPPKPSMVSDREWAEILKVMGAQTDPQGEIWFPNKPRGLWTRRWLAILAHEVTHRAQIRMGSTHAEAVQSMHDHGYWKSPIEVQARWMQRRVLRDLVRRAHEFFSEVLP